MAVTEASLISSLHDDLLATTLAQSTKDVRTTDDEVCAKANLPEGSKLRHTAPHEDARGSLFVIFSTRWEWDDEPFERVYCATMRPGVVKGWALHEKHADQNIGTEEVKILNMPTRQCNYADPDKYRLPLDTNLISHDFGEVVGW